MFGLHPATIRKACDSGRLACGRFGVRQDRRLRIDDLRRFLNLPDQGADQGEGNGAEERPDRDGAIRVVCACRTSSAKQDSSIENQKELLTDFLSSDPRFKGKRLEISWAIGRAASGMNSGHPWIVKLIADIQANKFDYLIVKDKSRLLRFATNLIETICRYHKCEVIFVSDKCIDDDLVSDLCDCVTSFTNRVSAKKSAFVTTKKIDAETLEWAARQQANGVSLLQAFAQLKKDGRNRDSKGRSFSYRTLARSLASNAEVLNAALSGEAENSFADFVKANFGRQKNSAAVLTRSQVIGVYEAYCGERNLPLASTQTIVRTWKELGGKITRHNHETKYVGLAFKPSLES